MPDKGYAWTSYELNDTDVVARQLTWIDGINEIMRVPDTIPMRPELCSATEED